MTRRLLLSLVAVFVTGVAAQPAHGVNSVLKFDALIASNEAWSGGAQRPVTLFLRSYYETLAPDANAPFAWAQWSVSLPREAVFNGARFPSCEASKLTTSAGRAACVGAEIGTVDAKGFALGLVEPLKVKIYNLPAGRGVAMYLQGDNPVLVDHVIEGVISDSGLPSLGPTLTFTIPPGLQKPAPGAFFAFLDFKIMIPARTVDEAGVTYPYFAVTGCASDSWSYTTETLNTDLTTASAAAVQSCTTVSAPVPPAPPIPVPPVVAPPVVAPPAVTPALRRFSAVFATRARVRGRTLIGQLRGIAALVGIPRNAFVEVACVRACREPLREVERWRGTSTRIPLELALTRQTIISIRITAPNGASRTQRYRFFSGRLGLTAREVKP